MKDFSYLQESFVVKFETMNHVQQTFLKVFLAFRVTSSE